MATVLAFKDSIDLPEWRPLAVAPNAHAAGGSICSDLRNSEDRIPLIFQLASATVFNSYFPKNDGWQPRASPALTGTFGAGAGCVVAPSRGPRGTIAAGATTSSVTLTTALPAAVGINQLADRCDGLGFKVRIIDNGVGGSGKIAEMYVIANTGGTTPTLTLSTTPNGAPTSMGFTPVSGSAYEFLSGRVYLLSAGTLAAGVWKYYDVATNSFSGNLSTTNLPATLGTDSALVALDETYVPNDHEPGEGFVVGASTYNAVSPAGGNLKCLVATAAAAGSITGQAAAGDASVLANEFRNFVIRIVEDTTNVTAVGQRRRITSHTAGPSAVYTITGNWTVTPSATAKFVIENNDEVLLFQATTSVYCYAQDTIGTAQTGDTWSTATYGVKGGASAAGTLAFQAFGVPTTKLYGATATDPNRNFRWSYVFVFRGGAANTLDVLDIAGGATGAWSNAVVYGSGPTFTTGSCGVYDPASTVSAATSGAIFYINKDATQNFFRFNAFTRQLKAWCQIRFPQGTALVGGRLALKSFVDGTTVVTMPTVLRASGSELFDSLAQR